MVAAVQAAAHIQSQTHRLFIPAALHARRVAAAATHDIIAAAAPKVLATMAAARTATSITTAANQVQAGHVVMEAQNAYSIIMFTTIMAAPAATATWHPNMHQAAALPPTQIGRHAVLRRRHAQGHQDARTVLAAAAEAATTVLHAQHALRQQLPAQALQFALTLQPAPAEPAVQPIQTQHALHQHQSV